MSEKDRIVKIVSDDDKKRIYEMFKTGKYTKAQVGKKFIPELGVSQRTISRCIAEMVEREKSNNAGHKTTSKKPSHITEEMRLTMYKRYTEGESMVDIAADVSVSLTTVKRSIRMVKDGKIGYIKDEEPAISNEPVSEETEPVKIELSQPTYIITPTMITVSNDELSTVIMKTDDDGKRYDIALKAIVSENWEELFIECDFIKKTVSRFLEYGDRIFVDENMNIFVDGLPVNGKVCEKIIESINNGENVDKYVKFLERAYDNPSIENIDEIWDFISSNSIKIDDNGNIVGYKYVSRDSDGNLVDTYTKTILNNVGTTVSMDRNKVDHDSNTTCSTGLHVCAKSYLGYKPKSTEYTPILRVIVDPYDVCSIPVDYNQAKMRCCKYYVDYEYRVGVNL